MKKLFVLAAVAASVITAGCSAGSTSAAPAVDPATLAQAVDRWQIEELLWRYARTLDSSDADGYVAVFTPDGTFNAGAMKMEGRDALHKFVADLKTSRAERQAKGEVVTGTLHMTANHHIDFTGPDSATVHSYWITMIPAAGAGNQSRVAGVGRAEDQLVRVDGKWLIKVRNVAPQE